MHRPAASSSSGIAVALSSSFYGFYTHAAFMAELHQIGIFPDQIAGTSSGAITAVLCGMGLQKQELINFTLRPGIRRSFWDFAAPLRIPGILTCSYSTGILSGKNARNYFQKAFQHADLSQFQQPRIQIAVTNLSKQRVELIESGDAASWMIASCAVPGLISHQNIHGQHYCDGGVANHTPFEHWLDDPSIHTIILHTIDHVVGTRPTPSWPTLSHEFADCHQTICHELHRLKLEKARQLNKNIIELKTITPHPGLFPHRIRQQLFSAGQHTARRLQQQNILHWSQPVSNFAR